jgi:hypothetical protein
MPLIGADMADYFPTHIGLTLVKGHFTTWTELHRSNFHADPVSILEPRVLSKQGKDLHERWMQWLNDAMLEIREDNPNATMADLERMVLWGGVIPMKITDSGCRVCAKPGLIIPVIAPLCWPTQEVPIDSRQPWDYAFPAEHLRVEVANTHDKDWMKHNTMLEETWQQYLADGWTPYTQEESLDEGEPWKQWTIADLVENGYDDVEEQLEEEVGQALADWQAGIHNDHVFIPRRVRDHWSETLDAQSRAYVTRANQTCRNITHATNEGFRVWQGVTGH